MLDWSNMLSFLPRSSSAKEQRNGEGSVSNRPLLYLNVYDLTPINNYLYWFGLGIFHSGIEVYGMEYGFGAHDYPASGVFEVEPKSCPGFVYRHSVLLGTTDMSRAEIRSFIEQLSGKYHGNTYHLIAKNCNHFTDDVCLRLTGKQIPGWVNRLARLGSFCNCLLPESIQVSTIRSLPVHPEISESLFSGDAELAMFFHIWISFTEEKYFTTAFTPDVINLKLFILESSWHHKDELSEKLRLNAFLILFYLLVILLHVLLGHMCITIIVKF